MLPFRTNIVSPTLGASEPGLAERPDPVVGEYKYGVIASIRFWSTSFSSFLFHSGKLHPDSNRLTRMVAGGVAGIVVAGLVVAGLVVAGLVVAGVVAVVSFFFTIKYVKTATANMKPIKSIIKTGCILFASIFTLDNYV